MEKTSRYDATDHKPDVDARSKDNIGALAEDGNKAPKKRRKVNHACLYCRRSHMTCDQERPCMRCIKRNIGHLCHDEPREVDPKKGKTAGTGAAGDDPDSQPDLRSNTLDQSANTMGPPSLDAGAGQVTKSAFNAGALGQGNPLQLVQPTPVSGIQPGVMGAGNMNQFVGYSNAWMPTENPYHDMHTYHPQYAIAPEVSNEFNLLNDFLQNSLLDDGTSLGDDQNQLLRNNQPDMVPGFLDSSGGGSLLPPSAMPGASMLPPSAEQGSAVPRPASTAPVDKTREYYLQAADPSGDDNPAQRMMRLLRAKHEAGLLKPFNYVKGYARLSSYLDSHHVAPASKQRIQRQLDRFRPKFREKAQALTDLELVAVEMWFESTLMEYDRVFASMAVPACCWRRTGEIFRGNKEMAELIHVPVEQLRDGKISLHEILTEESVVRYWEEFGTIAFDPAHDTLLTACSLKSPDDQSKFPVIKCCFSLKIRRDDHKTPNLIVGNFLPHDPPH